MKLPPPDWDEISYCIRWAMVWIGWAIYARSHDQWEQAEKYTDIAEDIFERLEARL